MAYATTTDDSSEDGPIKDEDLKKEHRQALGKFRASASFFTRQREREMQDLKFVDFGEQWDAQVKTQRQGNQAVDGLPITPPRPTITVDQLRGPCLQVASIRRQADIALEFVAKGGGATDDVAEAFEDIARAIQQDSRADIARNWAADRAEKAGMGWYRIDTEYCLDGPDADDPAAYDQQIVYRRILNQASVYPDALAQEPDFSDGKCLFVTEDMRWDDYKEQYKKSYLAQQGDGDSDLLTAIGDEHNEWVFDADGEDSRAGKTVRVAEYWEVVETFKTKVTLLDGSSAFTEDVDDKTLIDPSGPKRKIKTRKVMWSKINAVEYLNEPQEWDGAWIPIVPVIGEESNVNGERRWAGIVRPARDGAIAYNVMRSAIIEAIALATKAPYMGYWKSIERFQDWWKQSNVRNLFMLPLDEAYDKNGQLLPPPTTNVKSPVIDAMVIAANQAQADVRTATGISAVSLGEIDPQHRSGAAIKALQGQSEQGNGIYLDNLKRISIPYEGKILKDLIPKIYDRPGRIVAAHGKDDQRRQVMLNQPFTMQGKTPVAVPSQPPPQPMPGMNGAPQMPGAQPPMPPGAQLIDLTKGEYAVTAIVGKSYPTRKKEAADYIGNILQATPPEYAMALTPALLEEQDYPGAQRIAEIAKKVLPPNIQAAYAEPGSAPDPVQMQAQIQKLTSDLQAATQALNSKQMETQAKIEVANIQASSGIMKQRISTAGQMTVGLAKVDAENQRSFADAFEARLAHDEGFRFEVAKMHAQIASDHALQGKDNTHDIASMALQHQHEADLADQQHQHAIQLATTQAALAPEPQAPAEGTPNG